MVTDCPEFGTLTLLGPTFPGEKQEEVGGLGLGLGILPVDIG